MNVMLCAHTQNFSIFSKIEIAMAAMERLWALMEQCLRTKTYNKFYGNFLSQETKRHAMLSNTL